MIEVEFNRNDDTVTITSPSYHKPFEFKMKYYSVEYETLIMKLLEVIGENRESLGVNINIIDEDKRVGMGEF